MNLIKLFMPSGHTKEVTEVESWTVTWQIPEGWGGNWEKYSKVFINKDEASEFVNQLQKSAGFIKSRIKTDLSRN